MNNVFKENQNFWTWWLCLLLFGLLGVEVYQSYIGYVETGVLTFAVSFWIMLTVVLLFALFRLKTTIDEDGIEITFIPFAYKKRWKWDEIGKVYLRTYALTDFGGWGYRVSSQGIAYNTRGKNGIQMILKNGRKIMIGTQRPEEVKVLISKYTIVDEK